MGPPYKVTRTNSMVFDPQGECTKPGCEWTSGPARGALDRVKKHVRDTGHAVRVEHVTRSIHLPGH